MRELYSRRYKKENNLDPDIYQYEKIPKKLKTTLGIIIFEKALIHDNDDTKNSFCKLICDIIREEHSLEYLFENMNKYSYANNYCSYQIHYDKILTDFFKENDELLISLDIIELFCVYFSSSKRLIVIENINRRFLEHGCGYQFENNMIIKIANKHTHKEIIKPALNLLSDERFKSVNEEYREAFEAYKKGKYKTTISESSKALESTIKIIHTQMRYDLPKNKGLNSLIESLKENGFLENFNKEILTNLANTLKSTGIIRNPVSHGKGDEKEIIVNQSLASYTLHLSASAMIFLIEEMKNSKK